ncbi:hypothetical protein ACW5UC_25355 [Priestia aryabhattai]|uniref:hypothetical protein n=1 Tax=Priestia megaterium TaxID=1404 RepID=UPI003F9CE7D9
MKKINAEIHVINEDKMIYKVEQFKQIGSREFALTYMLELIAGWDYVEPDMSNKQGFISANMFTDEVQSDFLTVYPLLESLGERLKEEGYTVIDIKDYKINQVKLV